MLYSLFRTMRSRGTAEELPKVLMHLRFASSVSTIDLSHWSHGWAKAHLSAEQQAAEAAAAEVSAAKGPWFGRCCWPLAWPENDGRTLRPLNHSGLGFWGEPIFGNPNRILMDIVWYCMVWSWAFSCGKFPKLIEWLQVAASGCFFLDFASGHLPRQWKMTPKGDSKE